MTTHVLPGHNKNSLNKNMDILKAHPLQYPTVWSGTQQPQPRKYFVIREKCLKAYTLKLTSVTKH